MPRVLRPRRGRCGGCLVTHVLLPVTVLLRRAYAAEVIGAALLARAGGHGHRWIGAALQVPGQWKETRAYLDGDEMTGYEPFFQDYLDASRWVGDNAPDAVILARKPTLTWYWSGGRPSVVYPFHGDPERTWEFIRRKGITHIVLDPQTSDFLAPTLEPHWDRLEIAHASPRRAIFVLRLAPDG